MVEQYFNEKIAHRVAILFKDLTEIQLVYLRGSISFSYYRMNLVSERFDKIIVDYLNLN